MDTVYQHENDTHIPFNLNSPFNMTPTIDVCTEEVSVGKKKFYRCTFPDCSKTFLYKSELKRHFVIHSDEKPYYCTFEGCGKAFKRIDTLKAHLHYHSEEKPFGCEFEGCTYRTFNRGNLYYHSLKHQNNNNYKCDIPGCDKTFLTKSNLRLHQRTAKCHNQLSHKDNSLCETYEVIEKKRVISKPEVVKTIQIDLESNEKSSKPDDLVGLYLESSESSETQNNFQTLYEKIQKENAMLKQTLEIYSELQNRKNHKPFLQREKRRHDSFEDDCLDDDLETRFIDFLKEN